MGVPAAAEPQSRTNGPAADMSDILRLTDVTLDYKTARGPFTALENFSVHVAEGEFVSVLGPSGCGKSTLLKIVAGLLPVTRGEVVLAGQKVSGPRPDIGIVFQNATLLPWKNVLDNVLVPVRALKLPLPQYRDRAMELLRLVGLADFARSYPYELSGGMQQRVGIARGLVHDPKLILMDEPFSALDAMSREFMMQELQNIWRGAGKSVLFITHSIPEAVFLSDRVVTLSGRPGHVIDSREIPLHRPRKLETMADSVFGEYTAGIRSLFNSTSVLQIPTKKSSHE